MEALAGTSIVLSPHFDDAVFSCWHLLASTPGVHVINVFTAAPDDSIDAPPWDVVTGATSSAVRMAERSAEDRALLERLGHSSTNLGFLDAQYRRTPLDAAVVARAVAPLVAGATRIYVPADIGGHEDHALVRRAAVDLALHDAADVRFFGDIPRVNLHGWPDWMTGSPPNPYRTVDALWRYYVRDLPWPEVVVARPVVVELSDAERAAKLEAMRGYMTQFSAYDAPPHRRLSHPEALRFEVYWPAPRATR